MSLEGSESSGERTWGRRLAAMRNSRDARIDQQEQRKEGSEQSERKFWDARCARKEGFTPSPAASDPIATREIVSAEVPPVASYTKKGAYTQRGNQASRRASEDWDNI